MVKTAVAVACWMTALSAPAQGRMAMVIVKNPTCQVSRFAWVRVTIKLAQLCKWSRLAGQKSYHFLVKKIQEDSHDIVQLCNINSTPFSPDFTCFTLHPLSFSLTCFQCPNFSPSHSTGCEYLSLSVL